MPFTADMDVRVDETNVRYPDVSVVGDRPVAPAKPAVKLFDKPVVIFEVLSPSTSRGHHSRKLDEYRQLASE